MEFRVGEKVVYPNHGVGVIEEVTSRPVNGVPEEFYMLRIHANASLVMVPTANVKSVGLRKIIKRADVVRLLKLLVEPKQTDHVSSFYVLTETDAFDVRR